MVQGNSTSADERSSGTDRPVIHAISGYQAIVDHLRREISLGRIMPGDRLPAERKLAEQYGVARETLRQALRILEGSGQLVIQRGAAGGPVVQALTLDPEAMMRELRGRKESIMELIEFRQVIEPAAAGLAAERRDEADLARMDEAQAALESASTRDESRRADTAFHLAVAEAARNPMLEQAIEEARSLMFLPTDLVSFEFAKDSSYSAHEHVLEAIRAGSNEDATAAMAAHIATTREEFVKVIADS